MQRSLTVGGVSWLSEQRSDWWDGALHWIRDTLVRLGLGSSVEMSAARERPWSVTLSVRSPRARLFFKAVAPDRAYEVDYGNPRAAVAEPGTHAVRGRSRAPLDVAGRSRDGHA